MTTCLRIVFAFICTVIVHQSWSQLSITTDASILRNLNQQQKFWAFGQTVQANYHASKKETLYAWISYYTNGRFRNNFEAEAKDPTINPQSVPYTVYSALRYKHISLGWKHYFNGGYDAEALLNIYGYAGFGLLIGRADNRYSQTVDTSSYSIESPQQGVGNFNRLTFDIGAGSEFPLSSSIRLYTELRTWIAASHYPSPYLLKNNYQVPSILALNAGIRILFE